MLVRSRVDRICPTSGARHGDDIHVPQHQGSGAIGIGQQCLACLPQVVELERQGMPPGFECERHVELVTLDNQLPRGTSLA